MYKRQAPSLGYGSIDENVGALKNTGIEMVLNGTIINQNGWVWKLGMNLTHYKLSLIHISGVSVFKNSFLNEMSLDSPR